MISSWRTEDDLAAWFVGQLMSGMAQAEPPPDEVIEKLIDLAYRMARACRRRAAQTPGGAT